MKFRRLAVYKCLTAFVFLLCISISALSAQGAPNEITSYMAVSDDFNPDLDFVQVLKVDARFAPNGTWTLTVRLEHNDEVLPDGSEHYADRWEVVDPRTEEILAVRVLLHSHINEMPFSRSLSGIVIPEGLDRVIVRAACTHHGFEGRQVVVPLIRR
jgi:hypothetical protein